MDININVFNEHINNLHEFNDSLNKHIKRLRNYGKKLNKNELLTREELLNLIEYDAIYKGYVKNNKILFKLTHEEVNKINKGEITEELFDLIELYNKELKTHARTLKRHNKAGAEFIITLADYKKNNNINILKLIEEIDHEQQQ